MKKKQKPEDFVHLHTHSDMSQLDGCGRIADYVAEAHKRGNPAISFTDHGTMRGYYAQMEQCGEHDIKPVYGIEFYVAANMNRKGLTDEEKAAIAGGIPSATGQKSWPWRPQGRNRLFAGATFCAELVDGSANQSVHQSGREPVQSPGQPRFKGTYDNRFIASNPPQQGLNSVVQIHDLHG